jgi:hypothetical protein
MLEYTIRTGGLTYEQGFANSQALLNAFSKWKPEEGLTVHAFEPGRYRRLRPGRSQRPQGVASFVSKYNFWNDIDVVPVIDVGEVAPINVASLGWGADRIKKLN